MANGTCRISAFSAAHSTRMSPASMRRSSSVPPCSAGAPVCRRIAGTNSRTGSGAVIHGPHGWPGVHPYACVTAANSCGRKWSTIHSMTASRVPRGSTAMSARPGSRTTRQGRQDSGRTRKVRNIERVRRE